MESLKQMKKKALDGARRATEKVETLTEKASDLRKQADDVCEGISRIPTDLPEDLQAKIDEACRDTKRDLQDAASDLESKLYDAQSDADSALDNMREDIQKLSDQGSKLSGLRDIPIIGDFMGQQAEELEFGSAEISDLAAETQKQSDKLAEAKNLMMGMRHL